jgi:hypothetical protein
VSRTWSEHTSLDGGQLLTTSFEVLSCGEPLPSVVANRNGWRLSLYLLVDPPLWCSPLPPLVLLLMMMAMMMLSVSSLLLQPLLRHSCSGGRDLQLGVASLASPWANPTEIYCTSHAVVTAIPRTRFSQYRHDSDHLDVR